MSEKIEIIRQVNYMDEAYLLLYYLVNFDDMEKRRDEFADYYKDCAKDYYTRIDKIIEIYEYVKQNLTLERDKLDYYFKKHNFDAFTLASLALLYEFHRSDNKLVSYEEHFKSVTEEERICKYCLMINNYELPLSDNPEAVADLIANIEASGHDTDIKWEMIKIFNNQRFHYNEVHDILSEVIRLIRERYQKQIEGIEKDFYSYWSEYQKTADIIETITEKLSVSWNPSRLGIIVAPILFAPFDLIISTSPSITDGKDIIRISTMLDKRFVRTGENIKRQDVIDVCKILSDGSKLDILEYISKKPAYGKEIANELNLSAATISYHVSALSKLGFLSKQIINNRVFYSINREKISAWLDSIKNYFIRL
jgi:DNA-binding transcriptional ArsR family regulator